MQQLALSTLLDPRFKKILFNNSTCEEAVITINELYKKSFIIKDKKVEQNFHLTYIRRRENRNKWKYMDNSQRALALKSKCNEKENIEFNGLCFEVYI